LSRTEYNKKYYAKNKEHIKQKVRDWQQANKEYCKTQKLKKRESSPEESSYRTCQARAKRFNIPFNLELSDIVVPDICPYLGIPLTFVQGHGHLPSNFSIDRIIPELGYVKGNIRVISRLANQMKSSATIGQLLAFAEGVKNLHGSP
jgi:hypothetical protein